MAEEAIRKYQEGADGETPKMSRRDSATLASVYSDDSNLDATRPPNPFQNASIVSKLFFIWPRYLMEKKDKSRTEATLPDLLEADTSSSNLHSFQEMWENEKKRANVVMQQYHQSKSVVTIPTDAYPSLSRAIVKHFMSTLWFVQPCMFLYFVGKLAQTFVLGCLLQSIERGDGKGLIWAGMLSLGGIVSMTSQHHVFFWTWHKGMQYRISAVAAIYGKALRLKNLSSSVGTIVNLASNDCERFLVATAYGSYIIWGPLLTIAILVLGCIGIGWPFVAGFCLLLFVFIPVQLLLAKKIISLRSKIASITDERVALTSQATAGVRLMKIQGWEDNFESRISAIRAREIKQIQLVNWYRARNEALCYVGNFASAAVIFVAHVGSGGILSPRNVFPTFVLLNLAQIELTKLLALAVMGVTEAKVSVGRIQNFLQIPEHEVEVPTIDDSSASSAIAITLSNVTCHWNGKSDPKISRGDPEEVDYDPSLIMALDNITANFEVGQLTCVLGQVGSGKTALLQLLAGELALSTGSHRRKAGYSVAYAQQDPFLFQGTIKENILVGHPLDRDLYDRVIYACGLNTDFTQLRHGENTVVGDRGSQLSGGQRARVSLARALYCDSEILLLDDPFAAVDTKVGSHIFKAAVKDLCRGKCVVLVTHQHHFAVNSRCIVMANGRIECAGSYQECFKAREKSLADPTEPEHEELSEPVMDIDAKEVLDRMEANESSSIASEGETDTEVSATGTVTMNTYINYMKAMPSGLSACFLLLLAFCATQGSALAAMTFIGKWSRLPAKEQWSASIIGPVFGAVISVGVFALVRAAMFFHLTIMASKRLHDDMTKSMIRAKLEFFDTNPLGRILNRFSADVGVADDQLPVAMFDFLFILFMVIGAFVSALFILPLTTIFLPPLVWYFLRVRRAFLTTSLELKRIEGIARSPIFNCLSECLDGITTIRSNDAIDYFQKKFMKVHDVHSRSFFAFIACERWLAFRMDAVMMVFTTIVSFTAVIINDTGFVRTDPGVLGLAICLLLQLPLLFQYMIRQSAQVVNNMVSVDRVLQFRDLPAEAAFTNEYDNGVSNEWPHTGTLDIQDLSVRYQDDLPLSLHSLSFQIDGGSRVGIIGRTGSGKSTLLQSLLRLMEAESGRIVLDGIDISKIGLRKLRSSISVIPQTPVLFGGGCTLRENLDPLNSVTDEAIYEALMQVSMYEAVQSLPLELNTLVAENGSNFSVGQRQLLCLARAILRKSRVLILDEATANCDSSTDMLLQRAVAKSFKGATIIAVAHRLETLIDYDKIVVLDNGGLVECGSPKQLIEKDGEFASMVAETGDRAAMLRARALQG